MLLRMRRVQQSSKNLMVSLTTLQWTSKDMTVQNLESQDIMQNRKMEPMYFCADRKGLHLIWIHVTAQQFISQANTEQKYRQKSITQLNKYLTFPHRPLCKLCMLTAGLEV